MDTAMLPSIRSFVLRQGRLTQGQRKALDRYGSHYFAPLAGCTWEMQAQYALPQMAAHNSNTDEGDTSAIPVPTERLSLEDLAAWFPDIPQPQQYVIEVGFGKGAFLLQQAAENPHTAFIGIEVHLPGVAQLIDQAHKQGLHNIRIMRLDAQYVLSRLLPKQSINTLYILFPDPWHKKRHHKRRLIQTHFIQSAQTCLAREGKIHIATDWSAYALHIQEVFTDLPFTRVLPEHARVQTAYEKRGMRLGHTIEELVYQTVSDT